MRWLLASKITKEVKENLRSYSDFVAQLLFNRGITTAEAADKFFAVKIENLHDPHLLPNIDKAAEEIIELVKQNKQIVVFGDYDVDGVCSTSILFDFLYRSLNANVVSHIPNRFTDGYGMNKDSLQKLMDEGKELVITVDCGIRDEELVNEFTQKGLQFIITDHHELVNDKNGKLSYPKKALAVVHPNLPDSKYPFKEICATTVAWKLIQVIAEKIGIEIKATYKYLDLVALATSCDIMPAIDENRIILKYGLKQFSNSQNLGVIELMKFTNILPEQIESYHLGYVIGPRINAGGRIDHALDGVRLFTSTKIDKVKEVILKLENLNQQRQKLTIDLLEASDQKVKQKPGKLIFVWGDAWPEGVIGLAAGKLSERYNRPVLVASIDKGIAKGSARSIPSFHITDAISKSEHLLERFGGHSQAAGFTLKVENLEMFKANIIKLAEQTIKEEDLIKETKIDAKVDLQEVDNNFVTQVDQFKPYGLDNREPVFQVDNVEVLDAQRVGNTEQHLRLKIRGGQKTMNAIAFGLGDRLEEVISDKVIDFIGSFSLQQWNGNNRIDVKVKDFHKHND